MEYHKSDADDEAFSIEFTPEDYDSNTAKPGGRVPKAKLPAALERQLQQLQQPGLAKALKNGASVTPMTTTTGIDLKQFRDGVRVQHPAYGFGRILSVDGLGAKRRAIVRFDTSETKTFVLASSPLTLS